MDFKILKTSEHRQVIILCQLSQAPAQPTNTESGRRFQPQEIALTFEQRDDEPVCITRVQLRGPLILASGDLSATIERRADWYRQAEGTRDHFAESLGSIWSKPPPWVLEIVRQSWPSRV